MNNERWLPVENPDPIKRKPDEWAKIYGIKLLEPLGDHLWSEYEWAYYFIDLSYYPASQDFDKITEMEMRAYELRRDLFLGADIGEKDILNDKYIETRWIKTKIKIF